MTLQSEKDTERYLSKRVTVFGGLSRKYVSPSVKGVPDRICFLPFGQIFFVELKSEGKKLSPLQQAEHERLLSLGQHVYTADTKEEVDIILGIELNKEKTHDVSK